ncbi:TraB/GumN family protein [Luteimonas vadosa]|uniref:TraB/GumN family protein n=1 Tax=Luteimonas vadosa TaxID=1165507 RepID=A0ABP9E207_9GAMM
MTDALVVEIPPAAVPGWRGQPHAIVERGGVHYTLLGTAHVSRESVEAVREAISEGGFDAVAVELDAQRLQALSDPDALAKLDLVKVIREGKAALFAANLGLAAYQRRLAEQLGIEPGAELKAAVDQARDRDLPVHLVDRDVGITFKRISAKLGFFGRIKLMGGLLAGLLVDDEVGADDIEKLKQGDMLESSFGEFAKDNPALYDTLIDERDRYMAARLREAGEDALVAVDHRPASVLAVVGAGHLKGLAAYLRDETRDPATLRAELDYLDSKRKVPWFTLAITALVLGGIAWGYWRGGAAVGTDLLLQWVLITAGLAAVGCAAAGGHPLSILAGAIAAPLKPFRPGLPSGMFSALVELHLRKPAYGDFLSLRDDAQSLRGWYRNRVSRVVLNFILTNLGTGIGVWLAGARIVGKLIA